MFCYSGWNASAYVASEMNEPQRDLPRSLLVGTGLVLVLYLGLNAVYFYGAPAEELAGKVEVGLVAAERLFGGWGAGLVTFVLSVSLIASASAVATIRVPTDSGRPHDIYRCPGCETAVWSTYGGVQAIRFVRIGTLDEPAALPPDVHIYTRSKLPWVTLPAGVPAFEAYYSSREVWPAASLERRKAALGRPA